MFKRTLAKVLSTVMIISTVAMPTSVVFAEQSATLVASQIKVYNYFDGEKGSMGEDLIMDAVEVKNTIVSGPTFKIYANATDVTPLETRTLDLGEEDFTMLLADVHLSHAGGEIYLTVTEPGKTESERVAKTYTAEKSPKIVGLNIPNIVQNDPLYKASEITFNYAGLTAGTILRVYSADYTKKLLYVVTLDASYFNGVADASKKVVLYPTVSSSNGIWECVVTQQLPNRLESAAGNLSCMATYIPDLVDANKLDIFSYPGETGNHFDIDSPPAFLAVENAQEIVVVPAAENYSLNVYKNIADTTPTIVAHANASNFIPPCSDKLSPFFRQPGSYRTNLGASSALKLGDHGGTVYVAYVLAGGKESIWRTPVTYSTIYNTFSEGIPQASPPSPSNFIINNNIDNMDTITYKGAKGDIIKIYLTENVNSKKLLPLIVNGTRTINGASVPVGTTKVAQLGTDAGTVYATIQNAAGTESERVAVSYGVESASTPDPTNDPSATNAPSSGKQPAQAPTANSFMVANNAGSSDAITYTGTAGDIIKIYTVETGGKVLGTATVARGKTTAIISKSIIGATEGSVYATITTSTTSESSRTKLDYLAEQTTVAPSPDAITVTNNTGGIKDAIGVTDVVVGDTIKVYKDSTTKSTLGKAVAAETVATVTVSQVGLTSGSVYVTVTNKGKLESERVVKAFSAETATTAISKDKVFVTNNAVGMKDTVKATDLLEGDTITVYMDDTTEKALGKATVAKGKTEAIVSITQIGATEGSIYVTVANKSTPASSRVKVDYITEQKTAAPTPDNITIINNTGGSKDTVLVTNIVEGDTVKVYKDATTKSTLGKATVLASATEATVSIAQLGMTASTVYVTVTNSGKLESDRVAKDYGAETATTVISSNQVVIKNNIGKAKDTVTATGLLVGDTVTVYTDDTATKALGKATVAKGKSEIILSLAQLGASGGSVYVTLANKLTPASTRVKINFLAE
ncbi:MAG: hypothetical protein H7Y41_03390 [Hyphomonadaceae bacterium]|nr:hypothetical protein [Clostridia bacterium]